ncbi:MAG: hypothetical protein IPG22_16770 [Acidobacteria bacterium]|nr:hypothetical protein [Acidobacteriota bacterium]
MTKRSPVVEWLDGYALRQSFADLIDLRLDAFGNAAEFSPFSIIAIPGNDLAFSVGSEAAPCRILWPSTTSPRSRTNIGTPSLPA